MIVPVVFGRGIRAQPRLAVCLWSRGPNPINSQSNVSCVNGCRERLSLLSYAVRAPPTSTPRSKPFSTLKKRDAPSFRRARQAGARGHANGASDRGGYATSEPEFFVGRIARRSTQPFPLDTAVSCTGPFSVPEECCSNYCFCCPDCIVEPLLEL
jgi:hypothetical protein